MRLIIASQLFGAFILDPPFWVLRKPKAKTTTQKLHIPLQNLTFSFETRNKYEISYLDLKCLSKCGCHRNWTIGFRVKKQTNKQTNKQKLKQKQTAWWCSLQNACRLISERNLFEQVSGIQVSGRVMKHKASPVIG